MRYTIISQNKIPIKSNITHDQLLEYYDMLKFHKNIYRVELDIYSVFYSKISKICIEYSTRTRTQLYVIRHRPKLTEIIKSIFKENEITEKDYHEIRNC